MADISKSTIENLYQKIGDIIIASIDVPWTQVVLHVEIEEDDNAKIYGSFTVPEDEIKHSLSLKHAYELYVIFEELRRRVYKPEFSPWNEAVFTLNPGGDFDLSFSYHDSE
jgi:hypothetical protein